MTATLKFTIYKWVFKTFVAVYLLTNTFDIVMEVFDVAQHVVSESAGIIQGNFDVTIALEELEVYLQTLSVGELLGLWLEANILGLAMQAISLCIFIIIHG